MNSLWLFYPDLRVPMHARARTHARTHTHTNTYLKSFVDLHTNTIGLAQSVILTYVSNSTAMKKIWKLKNNLLINRILLWKLTYLGHEKWHSGLERAETEDVLPESRCSGWASLEPRMGLWRFLSLKLQGIDQKARNASAGHGVSSILQKTCLTWWWQTIMGLVQTFQVKARPFSELWQQWKVITSFDNTGTAYMDALCIIIHIPNALPATHPPFPLNTNR